MDIGSTYAARASTAASVLDSLKALRAQNTAQKVEDKSAAQKQAAEDLRDLPKKTRDDVRARAKLKVTQLLERLKLIREMGQNDPKTMARMLASLMKELKAAVKAYASAGGNSMDVSAFSSAQTAASTPVSEDAQDSAKGEVEAAEAAEDAAKEAETLEDAEPVEDTENTEETGEPALPSPAQTRAAAEAYVRTERSRAESELMDVHDFMKQVRAITRKVKDMFETAKIQLAFQKVDKDTVEAFQSSGKDMEEVEDMLDAMDKALNDERAVFGPKAALFA
ncbi:hypothetical protein [Asticcacaulis sp. AND118]|uniref:hypothetical protein n=1 Tax=Asticcacaulis sp. AND118 TaxID=2840468 RepID=UPI001D0002C3|nr:hypothetical protein [Asticcacaulis sp. AND118]UDF03685.1 hypothetical protein LH365_01185 [Asticcacaulis sp. AND118]